MCLVEVPGRPRSGRTHMKYLGILNMTWSSPFVRWAMLTTLLACAVPAQGRTISINLYRNSGDDNQTRLELGEVAGVVPVDGAHWNNIGFSGGDLSGSQCQVDQPLSDDRGNASAGRFQSTLTSAYVSYSGADRSSGRSGNSGLMGAYLAFDSPEDGQTPRRPGLSQCFRVGPAIHHSRLPRVRVL
jgi:hypothetical protein